MSENKGTDGGGVTPECYPWRVRETASAWFVEQELPCINGLSAWFTLGLIRKPDEAEAGITDGAIESAKRALIRTLTHGDKR